MPSAPSVSNLSWPYGWSSSGARLATATSTMPITLFKHVEPRLERRAEHRERSCADADDDLDREHDRVEHAARRASVARTAGDRASCASLAGEAAGLSRGRHACNLRGTRTAGQPHRSMRLTCPNCQKSRVPCAVCAKPRSERRSRRCRCSIRRSSDDSRRRGCARCAVRGSRRRAPRQASVVPARRRPRAARAFSHDRRLALRSRRRPLPRFARASIDFTDGTRVVLDDPRALSTLDLHAADAPPDLGLGPEPTDPSLTARRSARALSKKRGPIKPVLLDQRVIAGTRQHLCGRVALAREHFADDAGVDRSTSKQVADAAPCDPQGDQGRDGRALYRFVGVAARGLRSRGKPCRRCGTTIERIAQAGRSTYYCPGCQH